MANPYHKAAHHTGRAKMKAIHGHHFKRGGHVHADAKEDRLLISKMINKHMDHKVHGRKAGGRLDRHHRKVKISIEKSGPPGGDPMGAMGGAPGAGAGPMPTPMPPPGMSSGPMPQLGAGGMQKRGGRVRHRARGGRAYSEGESSKSNLKDWAGYASKNSFKGRSRGGAANGKPAKGQGTDHAYPKLGATTAAGEGSLRYDHAMRKRYP